MEKLVVMTIVRPERPGDVSVIRDLLASCFPTNGEARLVDALRGADRLPVSLVADVGGVIVGYVAFSPVSSAKGAKGVGLGPIAVADQHRCQGIAGMLVREGMRACREAGFSWAVVLGEPAYYSRFGFHPASDCGLADEYGGGDAFQVVELSPGGLPVDDGVVRYAPEFALLE